MKFIPHEYQKFCEDFLMDKPAAGLFPYSLLCISCITVSLVALIRLRRRAMRALILSIYYFYTSREFI